MFAVEYSLLCLCLAMELVEVGAFVSDWVVEDSGWVNNRHVAHNDHCGGVTHTETLVEQGAVFVSANHLVVDVLVSPFQAHVCNELHTVKTQKNPNTRTCRPACECVRVGRTSVRDI